MNHLTIKINNNSLVVSLIGEIANKNSINTNLLVDSELLYSLTYIDKNQSTIVNIINNLCKSNLISEIKFLDYSSAIHILPAIIGIECIKSVIFDFEISIKKDLYVILTKCSYIKYIECFYMPDGFVRQLGNNNISIKFNQNQKFRERFITENNLKSMNSMYYKRKIYLFEKTVTDFEKFLKINKSLKVVYLCEFNLDLLDKVLDLIGDRDISVYINQDESNAQLIGENVKKLKKINKSFSNFSRDISIVYSKAYFKNNFFKQINYNNIRLCSLIVIYIGIILLLFNKYNDYKSWLSIQLINQTLVENITDTPESGGETEIVDVTESSIEVEEEKEKYSDLPTTFKELRKINSDTVGWLVINNTKINYPVVKYSDNKYYLNHDFYKSRTSNGWIFMDYRNNPTDLDQNTILYGHSLLSKLLFGTLHNVLYPSWYKNKSNQIITFSDDNVTYKFQIFSIYKIDETSDYLKTKFYGENEFLDFVNMLKSRSIYDFGVEFTNDDKIITLSTCSGSNKENKRLVVHAKLLSD